MTTRFHSLKGIAALGLVVLTCTGLASCGGGGGSGPVSVEGGSRSSVDQMLIVPPSPNVAGGQGHPDLVVAAPTVNDRSPAGVARFTLSTTVRNDGDGAAAATTLRYYRSTDATITTSDTEVGTDAVAALADAGSSSESVDLTALASPGTYYYGACVDTVTDESDTTNIGSASRGEDAAARFSFTWVKTQPQSPVQLHVVKTQPRVTAHPDLVVGAPTVSDRGPVAGGAFHLVDNGAERWRRGLGGHDVALLPVNGRDDHDVRRIGGDGRGVGVGRLGERRRVGGPDGAVEPRHILLRRVRGRGDG